MRTSILNIIRENGTNSTLRVTSWENIEYAISIAPKSFKVKQS